MNRRDFSLTLLAAAAAGRGVARRTSPRVQAGAPDPLAFDPAKFVATQVSVGNVVVPVRAYEGLPVVARPVADGFQAVNVYVPEVYFSGGRVGRYDARTAPIFFPNSVGGYMPARPGTLAPRTGPPSAPGTVRTPDVSASGVALARGFVVVSAGARGRTTRAADGTWTGKAPAAIVDLKAAIRWVRHNAGSLPGNMDRIITNGTSAGGALSALLGASGNHPEYDEALQLLGAARTRDDVFAVSAFCPITNLRHADEAYEWQFQGVHEYSGMVAPGAPPPATLCRLSEGQVAYAEALRAQFASYVNGLGLRTPAGEPLQLQPDGRGTLRDHVRELLIASAQRALDASPDIASRPYLTVENGRITALDFDAYVRAIGRMKGLPAFDGFALETGENQLFGDATTDLRHFTDFAQAHGPVAGATQADARTVRLFDAMTQVADRRSTVAAHWHIRHGSADRDTAFAVPVLLAAAVRARGSDVDLALPWDRPHSGDYELDALFNWAEAHVTAAAPRRP